MSDIRPDEATYRWLQRRAEQHHSGDLARTIEDLLRAARIADEQVHHRDVDPAELPADPWAPLDEQLRLHRDDT